MTGATITELFEDLKENHEFVFDVKGTEYIIQPERRDIGDFLVIYPWAEGLGCKNEIKSFDGNRSRCSQWCKE